MKMKIKITIFSKTEGQRLLAPKSKGKLLFESYMFSYIGFTLISVDCNVAGWIWVFG